MKLRRLWKWLVRGFLVFLLIFEVPTLLRLADILPGRVNDRAHVIDWLEQFKSDNWLAEIYRESGVDIHFLLVSRVDGRSIEDYAVAQARALGIGREIDRRSILFVIDMGHRQARIEVGPTLQGIFTDAFIGYLLRNNLQTFFAAGQEELGLRFTLFILEARLRRAALGQEYDPRVAGFIEDRTRLATGGGASSMIPGAGEAAPFLNHASTAESRAFFRPQPSPETTYRRFLDWLRADHADTDVPLFDAPSQEHMAKLPLTRGYNDYWLFMEYGRRYTIVERGDLALQYFTDDPLLSPHFYHRTPNGWQMDIRAEVRNTMNLVGRAYTWTYFDSGDSYSRVFADQLVAFAHLLRPKYGDNRPLPTFDRSLPARMLDGDQR